MITKDFAEDDAYFEWLTDNPNGFVVNCYRKPTTAYLVLHRAKCHHIQKWEGHTSTQGDYNKVCSNEESELHAWAKTVEGKAPGKLKPCGSCKP